MKHDSARSKFESNINEDIEELVDLGDVAHCCCFTDSRYTAQGTREQELIDRIE